MRSNLYKIYLLLWKNFLIQKRNPLRSLLELLLPLVMSAILVALRFNVKSTDIKEPLTFPSFTLADCVMESLLVKKPWHIAYSPASNEAVNDIMNSLDLFNVLPTDKHPDIYLHGVEDEKEMEEMMSKINNTLVVLAGISFDGSVIDSETLSNNINVKIRFPALSRVEQVNSTSLDSHSPNWKTHAIFPTYQPFGPRDYESVYGGEPGYCDEGFIPIQNAVYEAILKKYGNYQDPEKFERLLPKISFQRFPYPSYTRDRLLPALISFVSMFILVSYTYSTISTIKLVTTEKETQMKEAMKLMGLSNWMHWTAWFLKELIQWLLPSIFITILLTYKWANGCVIKNTDPLLLLSILCIYSMTSIAYSFLVSTCFNKANSAATIGGALWFLTYSPYMIEQPHYESMSQLEIMCWSLISNTNVGYLFQMVVMYEGTGAGLQWHNMFTPVSLSDKVSAGTLLVTLFIDGLIYMILAIYIETAFPGKYGIPQPWYFPFQATYWFGYKRNIPVGAAMRGIQIKDLCKIYNTGKVAVRQLSLDMYPNQITVLLGHNGAGKSTTMSVLSGLIKPTAGTAIIDGYDIWSEVEQIRDFLGLCPQYDLLFSELTIREHLLFFGCLKGLEADELDGEIKNFLKTLEMEAKVNVQAGNLSGGYKRKLSVAIALAGKSKVVLLDEPTSGMDPTARRCLWDLLQSERNGRTMIMTTHLMDEADLLGDRVAIMNNGELKCVGTPFALKKTYGKGYLLNLVKTSPKDFYLDKVTAFLRKYNDDVQCVSDSETEVKYRLEDSKNMAKLLFELSEEQSNLSIKEFGVSLTSLEDVYTRVTAEADKAHKTEQDEEVDEVSLSTISQKVTASNIDIPRSMLATKYESKNTFTIWRRQFTAMLKKKMLTSHRAWFLHLTQILTTILFVIIATIVTSSWKGGVDLAPLKLDLKGFRSPTVMLNNYSASYFNSYMDEIRSRFQDKPLMQTYAELIRNQSATYLIKNENEDFDSFILKKYAHDLETVNERYIMLTDFEAKSNQILIHFNNQPYHALPISLSVLQNALYKTVTDDDHSLVFTNHPFPFKANEKVAKMEGGSNFGFQAAFNSGFAQAFVSSVFLVLLVSEQASGAKHLQFISGVTPSAYWLASLVWDYIAHMLSLSALIGSLYIYQDAPFSDNEQLVQLVVLLLAYNWAIIPTMSVASYLFKSPSVGFMKTSIIAVFGGCTMFLIVLVMEIRPLKLVDEADEVESFMIWFPHYALCNGLRNIYANHGARKLSEAQNLKYDGNYSWEEPGIGRNLVCLVTVGLIFNIFLLIFESTKYKINEIKTIFFKYLSHVRSRPGASNDIKMSQYDDVDVADEKQIVEKSSKLEFLLVMRNVHKKYGNFHAVKGLNLALGPHECFALLGSNGAGKTSTFKMLTAKTLITNGSIDICGMDIVRDRDMVSQLIGYCPQQDALLDKLTGRETLKMFSTLRGIPAREHNLVISQLSNRLIFKKFLDVPVGSYSGGNKRKLSTAVAMVGDPPVILLDEPTSGMDPQARLHLWNAIKSERERGKCIIITTHSLEECEALCTRLAIMVEGEMKCIGSVQHLKNKYASGYKLHVKFPPNSQENVRWFISSNLSGSSIHEEFEGMLLFHIPASIACASVFSVMEKAKSESLIEDYSIQQTSLEQVFIRITKK